MTRSSPRSALPWRPRRDSWLLRCPLRGRRILALCLFALVAATQAPAATRTNIVILLADDLGARDLGCYGSTFHETPSLDQLARNGARFDQAYAASPVCSPTRASLLTGKWPVRTGVTDYIGAAQPARWNRNTLLLPAPYQDRLDLAETTLPELLKPAGYGTFFAGKWHLGPEGFWPENQGFEINRGGIDRGGPYGGNKYFSPYGNPRLTDGPPGEHLPDRLATETVNFIEANRDRPFLVFLSFYSVHTPLMAREDLRRKYEEKRRRSAQMARWGREGERDVRLTQDHAIYAGMVEAMDQAVGKVLSKLDACGLADRTIVLFTSDNGGLSTSEGHPTSNHPLRAGKGWLYEGGIRVPLIVRWPGVTRAGSTITAPTITPDLFLTLLAAAGVNPPLDHPRDGISLLEPLRDRKPGADRPLFWHYPHYGNQGGAPGAAVRLGNWKLIQWSERQAPELFDLASDPGEQHDLSRREPSRTTELLNRLHAWQREVRTQMAPPNPHHDPSRPSGRSGPRPAELNHSGALQ